MRRIKEWAILSQVPKDASPWERCNDLTAVGFSTLSEKVEKFKVKSVPIREYGSSTAMR